MTVKKRVYDLLEVSKRPYDLSWYIDAFIIALIVANVLAMVIGSIQPIYVKHKQFFISFEIFSVIVFSVEYILRIWSANADPHFKKPVIGNFRYALTPFAIIDFLAVLPFYLPFLGVDLRVLRILRIFRLFRLFKIARYIKALTLIANVFTNKREELVISLVFTLFMLLITSTVMYYVENAHQPENFSSIPQTMWWGIATLTTVGYGDVYPITALGKVLGGLIALIGIGLFALPAGILASGFSEELERKKSGKEFCPTCGQSVSDI